jgi:voltage-gated potassium channel
MSATDGPKRALRRRIIFGLLRAVGITAVLITIYYIAPLNLLTRLPLIVSMILGLILLAAMTAYQVWAILRAAQPAVRAIEALATTVPLFLLLFAATYHLMSQANPSNFSMPGLTRSDSLYFTVTVFATVGFGDIVPATPAARLVVTAQMILNLIVLGLGVRLLVGAAQRARQSNPTGETRS